LLGAARRGGPGHDDSPFAGYGKRPSKRVGPCFGRPGAAARTFDMVEVMSALRNYLRITFSDGVSASM